MNTMNTLPFRILMEGLTAPYVKRKLYCAPSSEKKHIFASVIVKNSNIKTQH